MESPLASLRLPHGQSDFFPLPGNTFQDSECAKKPSFFVIDSLPSLLSSMLS